MSYDIYTSLSGARAAQYQMDIVAQNIANVSTVGYREQRVSFQLQGSGEGVLGQSQADASGVTANMADGAVSVDNDPNHFALQGEGFFVVNVGGEEMLTRVGQFVVDSEGIMTTAQGNPVMSSTGEIEIPQGETFTVTNDGLIIASESGEIGRFDLVTAEDISPMGGGLWRANSEIRDADPSVIQGALEGSNVDSMRAMVELIEASRYFEAYQKTMQSSDEMDAKLIQMGE